MLIDYLGQKTMNKLKVNRRDSISLDNIKKIVIKKGGMFGHDGGIYKKVGYPPILKCLEGIGAIKKRLVNLYCTIHDFEVEVEK